MTILRLLLLLSVSSLIAADAPTSPVDQLSQASIQSAFQVLRKDYIRREDLSLDQLNRASLEGLLSRLDFGAEIVRDNPDAKPTDKPSPAELLTPEIAYVRPVAYTETEMAQMANRLQDLASKGAKHLILDLRSPALPGEFEVAAAMLEFFLPRGTLLFKLKQFNAGDAQLMLSTRDPIWQGTVLALVDGESNNLGETIAAVLQMQKRALLIGAPTRGATVRYESMPLDPGWRLRYAHAEMLLPDDSSVFRQGVTPDFKIDFNTRQKQDIFNRSRHGSIKPFIFEEARARYNEAALVAGKNPELDDYIKRSSGEELSYDKAALHDTVVQRALDLLLTNDHFKAAKLSWKAKPATDELPPAVKAVPIQP
jgi:hypothetical protein